MHETLNIPILALDLGTTSGWCVVKSHLSNGYMGGGSVQLLKKGHTTVARYKNFVMMLDEIYDMFFSKEGSTPLYKVFYEKVRHHTGVQASHVYGGFETQLMVWGDDKAVPLVGVEPTAIKKSVAGHGHASKEDMIYAASTLDWKINPVDHNHADAMCLAYRASCSLNMKVREYLTRSKKHWLQMSPEEKEKVMK